jgi:hypothetical protein
VGGIGRWGEGHSLDFWTALERGEVDAAEIRAVDLLRRTTDPFRFAYYCQTATLPAMGNITGRIYMLERGGSAVELEDTHPVASWCISIGPHSMAIPGTDQVVVLRNFVEGEELEFMRIGNRSRYFDFYADELLQRFGITEWLPHIFLEPTCEEQLDSENEEILALEEIRAESWMDHPGRAQNVWANAVRLEGYVDGYPGQPVRIRYDEQRIADLGYFPGELEAEAQEILAGNYQARQDLAQRYDWDEAIEEMVDVHGQEIGEEIRAAIEQDEGYADFQLVHLNPEVHWFPEGQLYEPLGPVLQQVPGRRPELFLPLPAGAVLRRMPDGRVLPL